MNTKMLLFAIIASVSGQPKSFTDEAADVKNLMESVKTQTEGGRPSHPTEAKMADNLPQVDETKFDDELMKRADEVTSSMSKPKASLGQKKMVVSETEEQRAARFFALHGMKKIGHLLGDELTNDQEKALLKEQEAATNDLHAKTPVWTPGVKATQGTPLDGPSADEIEDEEDA